ncbi:MAG: hypothetical protein WDA27_02590 [Actinomycetota bacterium]
MIPRRTRSGYDRRVACFAVALAATCAPLLATGQARAEDSPTTVTASLDGESEAYGPRPAPYFQQLPIRLTVGHTFATAANSPYGGHAMSAVLNAGYIEGLLKPDGPSLSIQKADTDLTSPSLPRDFGPQNMVAQDAGAAAVEGGTIEAHSRPKPESVADASVARVTIGNGAVVARAVRSHSGVDITEGTADVPASAVSTAWSETTGIDIAGVVKIASIRQIANATATGTEGGAKADARTEIVGLEVAGTPAVLDSDGVHASGQNAQFSLGRSPDQAIDDALAGAGITLRLVQAATGTTKDGETAQADAGSLIVTVLRTVGTPVEGTPQQDAGIEMALGGAHVTVSARRIEPITPQRHPNIVRRSEIIVVPPVGPPLELPEEEVAPAPEADAAGPAFRIIRVMVRHFRPGLTAAFLTVLVAGILGPLLAFRRNPVAAAILAAPHTGRRAFLRYLVRG